MGIVLELARILNENPIDLSVDFILFDAEDNGDDSGAEDTWCLGSQYWSKQAKRDNYRADFGILLDLVGANGARYPKEGISAYFAKDIQNKIWNLAAGMGYNDLFINQDRGYITDDHYYVNTVAGIPMVDIINIPNENGSFGFYHHTHNDNMDIIDVNTLRRTGQVVLAFMYKYAYNDI
ncbi:MAG: M28 family peptidase [Saprospiraceae bacterium]